MSAANRRQGIIHTPSIWRIGAGLLALGLALLAGPDKAHAVTYVFTNYNVATFDDPGAWNPVGGPGVLADTADILTNGTVTINLTNNFSANTGTMLFGAGSSTGNLILTLNFGTNIFSAPSFNTTSASGFVFGQAGTSVVYISVGTLYVTNSAATPSNSRMIIGRNSGQPGSVFLTNGTVVAGNLVMANNATATPSKLVVSGPNSYWTNGNSFAIGNVASANNNSLVISNSGSLLTLSTFELGFQGTSSGNSVLVDTSGRLFTKNQTALIGTGAGSSNNTVTIRGGGLWDAGNRNITVGNTGILGNALAIGSNGTVSNVAVVAIAAGNSLSLSGGVLSVSVAVTNTSGTVSGFGTIVGNVAFTGTGTLSPSVGTLVGTLTCSNNLTLTSTSTTIIRLDSSQAGSNSVVNVVGTATIGGTLTVVTNGVAPLSAGDMYNIGITGGFATTNLPPLIPSLRWNNVTPGILAIVPQEVVPGVSGLTNQLTTIGGTVVISGTVTGVPTPGVYWQFNNVNVTDGAQPDGSTNSGSATTSLTIANAQTNESGTFCLIATNSVGASTNCMGLTVSNGDSAPTISGTSDQTVIQGNNGTFNAAVSGSPIPTIRWQQNGTDIPGATDVPLVLTNVQFAQDGFVYTLIASNHVGTATTNMTLHVIITPAIQTQPQSLVVTNTQGACFSVVSTNGVPTPTYQWFFNNGVIGGATNATYCISNAAPANVGSYKVQVSNAAGSVTSSNATLTVNSTMAAVLTPASGAVNVCYDTPLFMAFNQLPILSGTGKIQIFNVTNSVTPVDTIDTSLGILQSRTIGGEAFATYPIITNGNAVQIYPHLGVLSSNQQYYVTLDPGIFNDTNGATFAGITGTNGWAFTTKPTGPANPNNVVVAADESGDFCTCQGAVDSLPANNTTYTLINIRNGLYTELVDTKTKNNITFRGQNRNLTVVGYPNNNNNNGSTTTRMAFKVNANDNAIENMTVSNMTAKGGSQAEAIMVNTSARRCIIFNAEVTSFQDTLLIDDFNSQAYVQNSLIKGDTDFIWGVGNLFVSNSELRVVNGSASITQPRTMAGSNGLDFVNCQLTRSSSTVSNTTLARALTFCDGNAAFISCRIDSNVVGWTAADLSGCPNIRWWEYGNTDLDTGTPVSYNGTILTNGDSRLVCAQSATCWLSGWVPQLAPNILTNPVSQTVTAGMSASFNVVATGIPDPTYQWQKNGNNILSGTNATFGIMAVVTDDAGTYSVIVSNIAGSVTSSNATLTVLGTAPVASFTATPTSGTEPLGVTFTDTSSGSSNVYLSWNFGDANTSNTLGGTTILHTYAAGTYNVTLIASNLFGSSTLVSNNCITVITAFQAWQLLHFGCTNCPQAAATADPDGDGQNNLAEFLAGTDPNNAGSALRITSTTRSGNDVSITWTTVGGKTNVVQVTPGDGNGGFSTNGFSDLSGLIPIPGSGDATNNYIDVGGATNGPSRYYRIRLAP